LPEPEAATIATLRAAAPSLAGRTIGPFRVVRALGEGGMGVVYLAEQEQPIRRQVALKVIKIGLDSHEIAARFQAERQSLALMNHPGIARVLDAGATEEGWPYFVMEYVDGPPLTRFCDEHALDGRARLALFVKVCEAVQHAHQKGVIHRDLKPSNILVTMVDGRPQPKVIDFGIAKATGQRAAEHTAYTRLGFIVGTPGYMSPEQADRGDLDLDTTTDIYSLGVVLYELLVGAPPFDPDALRRAGYSEMQRLIRESEPTVPSKRLREQGEAATDLAKRRGADVPTLVRQLRGDLDWITLKAMEKDRSRRYASASELAADIARHLADEPVLARPPSARYRVGKLLQRHKAEAAAAAAMVLALAVLAVGSTIALVKVRRANAQSQREAAKAKAVSDFLENTLSAADPLKQGRNVTVAEVLEKAAGTIGQDFKGQPEVEAAVRHTVARTSQAIGLNAQAVEQARQALALREKTLGPDHPDTLSALFVLAENEMILGHYQEAEALHRRAWEGRQRVLGGEHRDTLTAQNALAMCLFDLDRRAEGELLERRVVEISSRVLGADHEDTLRANTNLANMLEARGEVAEAEALLKDTLERKRRTIGSDHPSTLDTMHTLGLLLQNAARHAESEPYTREVYATRLRVLGPDHPDTLGAKGNLALLVRRQGKLEEAEALTREVVDSYIRLLGDRHETTLNNMNNLGMVLARENRFEEAEKWQLRAWHTAQQTLPPGHWRTLVFERDYGSTLIGLRRFPEAEGHLMTSYRALLAAFGPAHRRTTSAAGQLASLYEAWGKPSLSAQYRALAAATPTPTPRVSPAGGGQR
jgi:non-specific serine/threonine protein kinase/serine/threonine-protein kinase